jgi:hypothetical protein
MSLATIVVACMVLLCPNRVGGVPLGLSVGQSGQTQQNSQDSSQGAASSEQNNPKQSPATPSKPCSSAQSGSTAKSDCEAASGKTKTKKKRPAHNGAKSSDAGPSKTVVRNGGTGEPTVAISSAQDQKEAARVQETHRLLDAADLNLKDVSVRGISPSQEATVKQIRSYMDEAKAAEKSGDVERAYNLASKANMLAADLNGR